MIIDSKIFVIENFYSDPMQIRKMALAAEYEDPNRVKNWPGRNSVCCFYDENMTQLVKQVTGENVENSRDSKSGYFRMSTAKDQWKQLIHFDPNEKQIWAGVWYGTPNVDEKVAERAGTKFWRHKQFDFIICPLGPEMGRPYGLNSSQDVKRFMETDGIDESKWINYKNIPFKFNRLILFRPWLWHSIGGLFGDKPENCRLVQLFFFDRVE